MEWLLIVAGALLGYLLGSVPVGVLATAMYGVDIRKVGSGRTGATNAWRAAGLKAAIPTVVGHNWSLFLRFKGGAGGITTAATIVAISPLIGAVVCLVGFLLIWWSRMASIGTYSVSVTALVCALVFTFAGQTPWPYIIFGLIAYLAVTLSLSRNRQAIKDGEERVITLW